MGIPISVPLLVNASANSLVTVGCLARLDLVGGWSDKPFICYKHGDAVCNVVVLVVGIGARVRLS